MLWDKIWVICKKMDTFMSLSADILKKMPDFSKKADISQSLIRSTHGACKI